MTEAETSACLTDLRNRLARLENAIKALWDGHQCQHEDCEVCTAYQAVFGR